MTVVKIWLHGRTGRETVSACTREALVRINRNAEITVTALAGWKLRGNAHFICNRAGSKSQVSYAWNWLKMSRPWHTRRFRRELFHSRGNSVIRTKYKNCPIWIEIFRRCRSFSNVGRVCVKYAPVLPDCTLNNSRRPNFNFVSYSNSQNTASKKNFILFADSFAVLSVSKCEPGLAISV